MDTCRIFDAQQLMEQYGPEAKFIVLNFHSALQFLDRCIEDIDNQMMQYYTPMEETDESEVDSAEIDNILDEVEGLEKDGRLVSVRESESDCAYSEMEDVGCYFTEDVLCRNGDTGGPSTDRLEGTEMNFPGCVYFWV